MPQVNPSEEQSSKKIMGMPTEEDMSMARNDLRRKRPDWTKGAVEEFVFEESRGIRANDKLLIENEWLYRQARTDALTGIPNKRAYNETIEREVGHAERGGSLSVIMIDIDKFKGFNDKYGHKIGDAVLIKVARTLESNLHRKKIDMIARYGGEEFVAILPGTNIEDVKKIAERLRASIEEETKDMEPKGVTISLGYATFKQDSEELSSADKLIHSADIALNHSKKNGRNRISEFKEGMEMPDKKEKKINKIETLQIEFNRINKSYEAQKRIYSRTKAIETKSDQEKTELNEELEEILRQLQLTKIRMSDLEAEK